MFVQRTAITAARRAVFAAPVVRRGFSTTMLRRTISTLPIRKGSPASRTRLVTESIGFGDEG